MAFWVSERQQDPRPPTFTEGKAESWLGFRKGGLGTCWNSEKRLDQSSALGLSWGPVRDTAESREGD